MIRLTLWLGVTVFVCAVCATAACIATEELMEHIIEKEAKRQGIKIYEYEEDEE